MTQINSKNHFKLALFKRCANRTQIRNEAATKQHERINTVLINYAFKFSNESLHFFCSLISIYISFYLQLKQKPIRS